MALVPPCQYHCSIPTVEQSPHGTTLEHSQDFEYDDVSRNYQAQRSISLGSHVTRLDCGFVRSFVLNVRAECFFILDSIYMTSAPSSGLLCSLKPRMGTLLR